MDIEELFNPLNLTPGTFIQCKASHWPTWAKRYYGKAYQEARCWGQVKELHQDESGWFERL